MAPQRARPGRGRAVAAAIVALALTGVAWYWTYGPCGRVPVLAANAKLNALAERYGDELKIAGATPVIGLSGPMSRLQDIRRETKSLEVPSCASEARDFLALAMERTNDGFMAAVSAHMEHREIDTSWQEDAGNKMRLFNQASVRLRTCAPRCAWPVWSGE
jgi:hypothetical protein